MNLARLDRLLAFGDVAVLALLGVLSLWVVAIVVERYLAFRSFDRMATRRDHRELQALRARLSQLAGRHPDDFDRNFEVAWRPLGLRVARGLPVLGPLGNSAPFIGLFGTVLGVIKAFQDLSLADQAGPQVVMAGISQALVATALGLLVAIPAAVTYNYFSLRQKRLRENLAALLWIGRDGDEAVSGGADGV